MRFPSPLDGARTKSPPAKRGGPAVTRLRLSGFRSYDELRLDVAPRPVVLTGPNGAGKTNLLEALSFLSPGTGLRGARLADVSPRGGAPGWAVAAQITTDCGVVDIGTGCPALATTGATERRTVKVDGVVVRGQAALAETLNLQWLTPQMDRLFVDGPAPRRRFLDRLVFGFDPTHAKRLAAYQRALRDRSHALKERRGSAAWLDAIEATMAGHGVAVAAARRDVVARLTVALGDGAGGFPAADIAVRGDVEDSLDQAPAVEVEAKLRDDLVTARRKDAETGGAGCGPHRSDLIVRHVARNFPAELCSTGEQKRLLLAIVLANARWHAVRGARPPVVLLDEAAAHLDDHHRAELVEILCDLGLQVWLTGTDATLFRAFGSRAQFLTVSDGAVTAAAPPGVGSWQ